MGVIVSVGTGEDKWYTTIDLDPDAPQHLVITPELAKALDEEDIKGGEIGLFIRLCELMCMYIREDLRDWKARRTERRKKSARSFFVSEIQEESEEEESHAKNV